MGESFMSNASSGAARFFKARVASMPGYKTPAGTKSFRVYAGSNENTSFRQPWGVRWVLLKHALSPGRLCRYADPLATRMRGKLAAYLSGDSGVRMSKDNVACFGGGEQAIQTIINAVAGRGEQIATTSMPFDMVRVFADIGEVEMVKCELERGAHFTAKTADEMIEKARDSRVKAVWIESVNNPLGTMAPREQIERILREVKDKLVVVDEAYYEFSRETVIDLLDKHANLVIIRSMSKAFGLAKMRAGYLIASEEVAERLRTAKPAFPVTGMTQEIAEAALAPRAIRRMKKTCERVVEERERVVDALTRRGWQMLPAHANFVAIMVPGKARELFEKLQKEYGIVLRACTDDLLRMTVGTRRENNAIIEALSDIRLQDALSGSTMFPEMRR